MSSLYVHRRFKFSLSLALVSKQWGKVPLTLMFNHFIIEEERILGS